MLFKSVEVTLHHFASFFFCAGGTFDHQHPVCCLPSNPVVKAHQGVPVRHSHRVDHSDIRSLLNSHKSDSFCPRKLSASRLRRAILHQDAARCASRSGSRLFSFRQSLCSQSQIALCTSCSNTSFFLGSFSANAFLYNSAKSLDGLICTVTASLSDGPVFDRGAGSESQRLVKINAPKTIARGILVTGQAVLFVLTAHKTRRSTIRPDKYFGVV